MDFNDYFERGIALFEKYEYGLALENFRAAQKLNDTPDIRKVIEIAEQTANANAQKTFSEEKATELERRLPNW